MSKEMYISSSPHETKVAVLEDDQLVEVYFERDTDVGLVGGIYKGRVSRVLPGMQSAFVDIGLERDAFLYVSDFFYEDQEEYDKVFEEAEARATKLTSQEAAAAPVPTPVASAPAETAPPGVPESVLPAPAESPAATEPASVSAPAAPASTTPFVPRETRDRAFDRGRGRRRRHRGRPDFGEGRHGDRRFQPPPRHDHDAVSSEPHTFEILPGESLAKYSHSGEPAEATSQESSSFESAPPESTPAELLPADVAPVQESAISGAPDEGAAAEAESTLPGVDAPKFPENAESASPEVAAESDAKSAVLFDADAIYSTTSFTAKSRAAELAETPDATGATLEPSAAHLVTPVPEPEPEAPRAVEKPHEVLASPATEAEADAAAASQSAPVEAESPSDRGELDEADESIEGEEEGFAEGEDLAEGDEAVSAVQGESATGREGEPAPEGEFSEAPGVEGEGQPATAAAGETAAEGSGEAPAGRSYTLREPNQRPRFAPRRRRGRRGFGGGQQRRFDKQRESRPGNNHPVQIAEVLKEGQEILVQIAKEPLGTKGARITSHVALPGRYLVYMPTIDHIGVSRKIASEEERLRLRNIILENKGSLTGGFIVRTAGQGRSEDEFKADLKFLSTLWSEIRAKSDRMKAPALIHRDLDLVQRLLRDLLTPDFKSVRVDNEIDYERVLEFVNRCQPALIGKVKLYSRDTPIYEEFGIQAEIEKALKPKVWLKSGGYIVINQTEALVAIDVNTGKYVGKTNRLEDTILKTNVDAVNEIVRQVRLRDLGGIIVIDFIDMDERKNRAKVVQALEDALRSDRAPTKVISFHDFGLVAITRKRVKQSLERTLCEPCDYCSGAGWIKSVNTVCNEILAEAKKMSKGIDGNVMTVRVNPEVAKALKSREGNLISELESITKKDVIIKSDASVHQERFEIF